MAKHIEQGKRGEELAARMLAEKGYEILERNWRFSRAEVDLIARQQEVIIFIEVKTRRNARFGTPSSFISPKKQRLLVDAANVYCEQIGHEWEIRFDVFEVIWEDGYQPEWRHLEDAFFPGL